MSGLKDARLLRTRALLNFFRSEKQFGHFGKHVIMQYPSFIDNPQNVFLADYCRIRHNATILNSPNEKVYIGKYTVLSIGCTIVTNNHRSTVGIPQYFLGPSHINDKSCDLVIGEDVWGGVNVTILAGANIGRGAILAANCLVNKPVPPYAVVAGVPAKIIAVKFSKEQIMEHERQLYSEEERMTEKELNDLFEKYYKEKKVYGTSDMTDEEHETLKSIRQQYRINE